ncbi:MAG: DUF234 domain-containing protein [Lachnospiraceae bacterium]|nr:DUF234 domain-containing protein [Lachnospiraceae bacterium]
MAAVVSDRMEGIYTFAVEQRLSDYMGLVFERMCRDYLLLYDSGLPVNLQNVGQWWGGNPVTRKQAQIDIVALSAEGRSAIVGSCKFRNEVMPRSEWDLMKDYTRAMGGFDRFYYYLFSKSGFEESLIREDDGTNLRLVTLDEMY